MRQVLDQRLAAVCHAFGDVAGGRWSVVRLEPSLEGRPVAELSNGDQRVIAKLGTDDTGAFVFHQLMQLQALGTKTLRVPRPLAWLSDHRALMLSRAGGRPLRDLDPRGSHGVFARIGQALAELHASGLHLGEVRSFADHLRDLIRPEPSVLAEARPQDAARIHGAIERLHTDVLQWGPTPVVPLHRDFHLRQLFDDGQHVTVLDWDDAAMGDPAFDVAYFTAYLRNHHGDTASAPGIGAFLGGYGVDAALTSRLATYERFNALRRAARRFRLQDTGWEIAFDAMLERANSPRT